LLQFLGAYFYLASALWLVEMCVLVQAPDVLKSRTYNNLIHDRRVQDALEDVILTVGRPRQEYDPLGARQPTEQ
jgi:hypothetical protein